MNKYRNLLLVALALIVIGFLIPNSLHINDYYNTINYTNTICLDCNWNQQDFFGLFIFIIIISTIGIIFFLIIRYKYKKKEKNSNEVIKS